MRENAHATPPERRRGVKRCLRGELYTRVVVTVCSGELSPLVRSSSACHRLLLFGVSAPVSDVCIDNEVLLAGAGLSLI